MVSGRRDLFVFPSLVCSNTGSATDGLGLLHWSTLVPFPAQSYEAYAIAIKERGIQG